MKFLIVLMLVAVASAGRPVRRNRDVSEYYGAGWSKRADGYSYDIPTNNLDNTVTTTYYEEPVYTAPAAAPAPVYSAPATTYTDSSPSYTATTTYTDTGFSTSYGPDAGATYTDAAYTSGSGSGSYGATEYYPSVSDSYTQDQSLREYLPPALRRRRLRLQKRKLRFAKRH